MFRNVEELFEELNSGKKIKEIVLERMRFLYSEEYENNFYRRINQGESNTADLIKGFINNTEVISVGNSDGIENISYVITDNKNIQNYIELLSILSDEENFEEMIKNQNKLLEMVCGYTRFYFDADLIGKNTELTEAMNIYIDGLNGEKIFNDTPEEGRELKRMMLPYFLNLSLLLEGIGIKIDIKELIKKSYLSDCYNRKIKEGKESLLTEDEKEAELFWENLYKRLDENEKYRTKFNDIKFSSGKMTKSGTICQVPIELSELQFAKSGVCVEHAIICQNYLSFLGYNVYLIRGYLNGGKHQFNVIEHDGKFYLFDTSQSIIMQEIKNVKKEEDLLYFGEQMAHRENGEIVQYTSAYSRTNEKSEKELRILAQKGAKYRKTANRHFYELYIELHKFAKEG